MDRTPALDSRAPLLAALRRPLARRQLLSLGVAGGAAAVLAACGARAGSSGERAAPPGPAVARPEGWADATHGNRAAPNYALVFPRDRVNTITFAVTPETWAAMLANMTELFGARGSGTSGGFGQQPPGGGFLPRGQQPDGPQPEGAQPGGPQPGGAQPGAPGRGPGLSTPNPAWFPGTVLFERGRWTSVGLRFKGNSSLRSAWSSGSDSIPFKLDFDEFEDDHPEIDNQRFHGFKQLSLANNFGDQTGMRETISYDVLRRAGLAAANTGFYEVFLDRGEGPTSLGLYTLIEVIDDTVVRRSFKDASGTIFEADGQAASLAAGTFGAIPSSFEVEGGKEDWGPIERLYTALHAETRLSAPAAWRAGLETVFEVESFLRWLGISAALVHWDTYGQMLHNYYLYDDPSSGRLTWISWDHNLVLGATPAGRPGSMPAGARGASFDHAGAGTAWPLIRFLLDDTVYAKRYLDLLRDTAANVFVGDWLDEQYVRFAAILEPHVPEPERKQFADAVAALRSVTRARVAALAEFLRTA